MLSPESAVVQCGATAKEDLGFDLICQLAPNRNVCACARWRYAKLYAGGGFPEDRPPRRRMRQALVLHHQFHLWSQSQHTQRHGTSSEPDACGTSLRRLRAQVPGSFPLLYRRARACDLESLPTLAIAAGFIISIF